MPIIIISISIIFIIILNKFYNNKLFWGCITVFIFFDLFFFGHFHDNAYHNFYFLKNKEKNEVYSFLKGLEKEKNTLDEYRIMPLESSEKELCPNLNMIYGVNNINAYSPILLKNYKDMTGFEINGISSKYRSLIRNSRVLSSLSTKYILTSSLENKLFIESIIAEDQKSSIETIIIDNISQKGWDFFSPYTQSNDSVILKSKNNGHFSLIQYKFTLEKNTDYKISFKAKTTETLNKPLIVDFFIPGYDSPEQESVYDQSSISTNFKSFVTIFYSGENAPEQAYLRFFTFSTIPVEIRDIRMVKLISKTFDLDHQNDNSSIYPLYQKNYETKDGIAIYENMNFLPRSRFVQDIRTITDYNDANHILWNDLEFNASKTALVEGFMSYQKLEIGEVLKVEYRNSSINLLVETGDKGFLVISDTWYPGWKAYIDGNKTTIYKTYGILRGIFIKGDGIHKIRLVFRPISFYIGLVTSIISLLVIIGFLYIIKYRYHNEL